MRTSCMPIARRRAKRRVALSIALVPLIVLAACGDDDDDDAGATTPAAETTAAGASDTTAAGASDTTAAGASDTTAAGASDTTAAGGSDTTAASGEAPSGDPIKVMTIAPVNTNLPPYPNIPAAAEIYMQYINDRGGIQGRPLEVITCDDQGDPNVGANCARQAVDEGAIAVVGSFVFDASRIIPVLEENNIPWFGACCPLVEQEFSSPISFPLGSLLPGQGAGLGWKMAQDGCENPVNVVIDIPAGDVAYPALVNAYEVGGGDPDAWRMVKIPPVPGDYSAQVADADQRRYRLHRRRHRGLELGGVAPGDGGVGADVRLYGLQGNLNSKIAEEFPELTEGGVVSNSYPNIEGPMWDDYRASLEEYDAPDLDWNSLAGLGTWTAYTAFKNVVEGMSGEITNETFLEAINATTALNTDGMIGELDLTTPYEGFGGGLPRIFNRTVFFDIISDGKLTAMDDQAYDMTGPIDGQPMSE